MGKWLAGVTKAPERRRALLLRRISAANALGRIESGAYGAGSQYWSLPYGEPKWVSIPDGEFWMGSGEGDEQAYEYERPLHKLYLPEYQMAVTPVTNAQFAIYIKDANAKAPVYWQGDQPPGGIEDHPVVNVTWHEALAYCRWLSEKIGKEVILPSEAEWEKAARGPGSTRIYPWGSAAPDCQTANIKVKFKSCRGDVQPVGSYPKDTSLYGIVDLAGNVREWVSDWYDPGYYYNTPYQNPRGPLDGIFVAMRGGRFDNAAVAARIAARRTIGPNDYGAGIGFRCAYTPIQP
jgi:formylglycine-generating enzyme required for sulfatase activity